MTHPDAAARHVVDRCPSCGVEHDVRVDACEACHTPLRYWCRAHGHETGWLKGPACARCAEEAARAPAPAPPPTRAPVRPTPGPKTPPAPAPAPEPRFVAPARGRPLREVLGDSGTASGGAGTARRVPLGIVLIVVLGLGLGGLLVSQVGSSAPLSDAAVGWLGITCGLLGVLMILGLVVDARARRRR
jgi:hypothetical protein